MARWRSLGLVVVVVGTLLVARPAAAAPVAEGAVVGFGGATSGPAGEGVVAMASTDAGWWTSTAAGRVVAGGGAVHRGEVTSALNAPVVGMAATPSGGGYWLLGGDGGIFTFGDAAFHGSTGGMRLNRPVVGMAPTPSGRGYWLVASDGGIFTFGDAPFHGSAGGLRLQQPVVGMAPTPSGRGYWLVAADGGVFTYGDAPFAGAASVPAVGLAPSRSGRGYWIASVDGRVVARGDAAHAGDLAGRIPDASVAAVGRSGDGYRLATAGVRDSLELWEPGGLQAASLAWTMRVAERAGARATVWHWGNLDLLGVKRGGSAVQAVPAGWRVPMSTLAVDAAPSGPLLGPAVTGALLRGEVAMGAASATLRGARVGDTVDLLGWNGRIRTLRIGAIADDVRAGWAELVLATGDAAALGFHFPYATRVWGADRGTLERAMRAEPPPTRMGLDPSWVPTGRDLVAPSVRLKQVLGEAAYRPTSGDGVALHPAWMQGVVRASVPVLGTVTCHQAVLPALRGALTEIARAGLGGALSTYGGCHSPRLIRGGDSGGRLSRHSYGIAVDVNTDANSFGGRVSMHPTVVSIFRRWGFAWGGTWVRPDGMHFEWAP